MSLGFGQPATILNAGKHTACLETDVELDDGSTAYIKGTAFFVSENLLLTAAHNVVPQSGRVTKVAIRYEGAKKVEPVGATLKCRVLALMPKSDPTSTYNPLEDLAILECIGHDYPHFLIYQRTRYRRLRSSTSLDILARSWLEARHPELGDYDASRNAAHKLLPRGMLTATEGKISSIDCGCASYEISTVGGMSGGCLFYDGKVYGISVIIGYVKADDV